MLLHRIGRLFIAMLICLVWASLGAGAQNATPAAAETDQPLLSAEQLDALVAPIALYPDPLLAQVLMASTYPLEVVQADRWLRGKKQLKEDALKAEAAKQPWDESVKSLIATPSVLDMLSQHLEWTEKLGNTVLAQQADVMAAVQRLRVKAYDNKKLSSTKEQTVTVRQEDGKPIVAVEPAAPDSIAVPYYDPAVVYDPWPYTDYPPYHFAVPDYIPAGIITSGIAFGTGYLIGRWVAGDYWYGGINWNRGEITIDRNRVTHWHHNPQHRRGVQYTNSNVRQTFSNADIGAGRDARENLRLNPGDRKPGADRPGASRPGADRPGAADRGSADRKQAVAKGANRKQAAAKGGPKSTAKRTGSPKTAAANAKRTGGGPKRVQASARHSVRHTQQRPAAARAIRPSPQFASRANPRFASFGGRGRGRGGFRGGGRRR